MSKKYYRIEDDLDVENRWFLNGLYDTSGAELDPRDFTCGVAIDMEPPLRLSLACEDRSIDVASPLMMTLRRHGKPLDFTFAGFEMPVVTSNVANIFASFAGTDIQRIPVVIDRQEQQYEIINVISCLDCIDLQRSEIEWFEEGNDIRPDLAGTPEMITKLVIDTSRICEHNVFRLQEWKIAMVVSDIVMGAITDAHVSGIKFERVS